MTDDERPGADPGGHRPDEHRPDEHVLRLARWHADLVDDPHDDAARRAVAASPEAADVLAALDHVRAELADTPSPAPPPSLLAGIDRALAAERSATDRFRARPAPEPVPGLVPTARRLLLAALVAVVVAGLAGAGLVLTRGGESAPPAPTVAAPPGPGPAVPPAEELPVVHRDDPTSALATGLGGAPAAVGGPLADPGRLTECLTAHGVPAGVRPVGMRRVQVDGRPRVLIVLPTGIAARFRVLVVGDACSAATPLTLADSVVGR